MRLPTGQAGKPIVRGSLTASQNRIDFILIIAGILIIGAVEPLHRAMAAADGFVDSGEKRHHESHVSGSKILMKILECFYPRFVAHSGENTHIVVG